MVTTYKASYAAWQANPEAFWSDAAAAVDWIRPADKIFDPAAGVYGRWFVGAQCNTCFNCIDRHIAAGHGARTALIYDSPVTGQKTRYSYEALLHAVSEVAAGLVRLGVGKGDRVLIYMPMIPQTVFAMLACARIGAVHSVVFGGFAPSELTTRINDAQPKVILSASCGIEASRYIPYKSLLDEAVAMAATKPQKCVIFQREQALATLTTDRDIDWDDFIAGTDKDTITECTPVAATDPLYILYTSGTTGEPKGVVRDNGGHMVALSWSMRNIFDTGPGEVFWAASDVGWVVGHSFIVYGPLLAGGTTVLYEGKPIGTPDAGAYWRVIEDYGVSTLFTAPTALRAIRKADSAGSHVKDHDISSLKTLFVAGERADPDTLQWAEDKIGVPVIDNWWQTETGWPIAANPVGLEKLPVKHGSPGVPMPGYDVQILGENGAPLQAGELGAVCLKLPLPPGCLPSLWAKDGRFEDSYLSAFPGYYETSDAGYIDHDGYVSIMARTDDIINVAGHRLSTGAMEEVLASHPDIAECAIIGVYDPVKGQVPVGLVVLNDGAQNTAAHVETECIALVRQAIGAVAALKQVIAVAALPKTRSGKVLRATIRKILDHEPWQMPPTVEDPAVFDMLRKTFEGRGLLNR